MDGWEFCRHLQESERLRRIPVIVVTGYSYPRPPEHALVQFKKPIDMDALRDFLNTYGELQRSALDDEA